MNVLLPVCISIGVLGLVVAVLLWMRGRRGRAVQAIGVAALPFGLYLTGLFPMVWSAAIEVARWAGRLVFSPPIWAGFSLLAVAVVLWVVGGMVARRTSGQARVEPGSDKPAVTRSSKEPKPKAAKPAAKTSGDDEFDEIEALLKQRGIE